MTASLAYRNNADAIWNGKVPEKYRRLMPFIEGDDILELGAAEGVLAMLLAERGANVTALERNEGRHEQALELQTRWFGLGRQVQSCNMEFGDIRHRLDLMNGIDTLVAIRSIYYLRDEAVSVLKSAAVAGVKSVVLCGNGNRAARFETGKVSADDGLGEWNWLATVDGMKRILTDAGYEIDKVVTDGDPIVTGRRH